MAEETPRDADAETTYIALTARLEEQYIENLAFIEARGGIGENGWGVRDAFLDAADAVARLSPDERAARVAVARARAAAPPLSEPAAAPPAFGVPPVSGRFRGLGTAWGPRAPAPVGGQRPFAPRPVAPRAAPAPFVPQISCSQPGVTVSVSLWLPDVAHVDVVVQSLIRGDEAMVALRLTSGAVRRFGLRLSGAPARAYGQANPGPSTLVTITFVKQRREIAWPEPLAVVIPHDGASHPRTADEMLAEAMAPAPAPAPAAPAPPGRGKDIAALRRSISAADDVEVLPPPAPRTPGAPAPAPTLVTPAAPAPAPADDDDGVEMHVMTPEMLKKRRFDEAIANGEVIEIPSDDDEAPQVAPDAATQARLDAAAEQRRQIDERKRQRVAASESAFTEARAAQYIRDHRFFPVSTLTAKCRAAGLKVSGKKNELVARLALWHGLRIFDGPRTRRHRDRVAQIAENLDRYLSAHPAPGDEGRGYYPMPGPYGMMPDY